ncbi:ABC transporter permease [Pseudonocardiaceae bacterium YIM PH 21723]|nr:ABC transporter permease [Pseudonocardiaceae bacterium YIM PH 21723]
MTVPGMGGASRILLPVLGVLVSVFLWWLATVVFSIENFLLPGPQDVLQAYLGQQDYLLEQAWVTLLETIEGFVISIVVGIPIALLIVSSQVLERMIYPLLLAVNAIPKIALAPLLVVWLDFGMTSKVVMVFLVCFFPIVISTATGMKSTPAELVELMRSLNCTRTQEFAKLRLQYAMPQIFTGLKVAVSLAVIGAVIGEFVGAKAGLGFVIVQSGASVDTALAFAAIGLLAVMSIGLFYLLVALERWLLPWAREER